MDNRIEINPRICHGKPVIRGTRVLVSTILGSLAGGMTADDVQSEYEVTREDLLAALKYAPKLNRDD